MKIFGQNYKTKWTPLLLGLGTLAVLVGAFVLSSTYSIEVLAQTPTPQQQMTDNPGGSGFVICGNEVDNPCRIDHLFIALVMIINYLISVAGLVALLFIVIAGVQMTASRGEGMLTTAKKRLTGAVIGLVLVALAFVLVNSLFAGSFALGIRDGGLILTNPKAYLEKTNTPKPQPQPQTTPPIIQPGR